MSVIGRQCVRLMFEREASMRDDDDWARID